MPSTGRRITSPPTTPNTRGTPTTIGLMPRETQFFTAVKSFVVRAIVLPRLALRSGTRALVTRSRRTSRT